MSHWYREIHISGGFLLITGWFTLVNGWELLAVVLSAAAIHEAGHLLVLRGLGVPGTALRLSVFGAEIEADCTRLSYPGELCAVLAGPFANLLCGMALASAGAPVPAGAHLALGAFNLLPVRPLDGGKALCLAASWCAGPAAGEQVARWAGGCTALALACLVIWLVWRTGGSLWLLPAAAGLLGAAGRELRGPKC